ncbi:MAG: hypothetical protein KAT35_00080, partial [Candidatus Aenigmarchaeota archaeon]|nr:hypothetical protein [Candidatus Aenigmarchaeota archaeon]
ADVLLEYGVNTVSLGITVTYLEDGTVYPDDPVLQGLEEDLSELISEYHENGIAVMLAPEPMPSGRMGEPSPVPEEARDQFLETMEAEVIRWAEFAESERVEFFAPLNEPDRKVGEERAISWSQQVLPGLREVYTGKVVWKGDLGEFFAGSPVSGDGGIVGVITGRKLDFSNYDVLGFTVSPSDSNLEQFRSRVKDMIDALLEDCEESGVPEAMITEIGVFPHLSLNDQQKVEAHEIVFEEAEADGRVKGVFVLDQPLDNPNVQPLKDSTAGTSMMEFYTGS